MATKLVVGWLVWSLAGMATAQAPATENPKLLHKYAQLNADAAKQKGSKRAETLGKMAEMEFEFARAGYSAQQPQQGGQQLDLATQHADQASALLEAEAAMGKTNGMKNVEVSLQSITYGLKGLAQQVHYRERPKVEAALAHISELRAQILNWMFTPKHR